MQEKEIIEISDKIKYETPKLSILNYRKLICISINFQYQLDSSKRCSIFINIIRGLKYN